MRSYINNVFRRFGYQITRFPSTHQDRLALRAALARVSARDLPIGTIIDVGASNGQWSRIAQHYYPDAAYFLIEANPVHAQALVEFKQAHRNVDYMLAAASDVVGEVYFDASEPFGGSASHALPDPSYITVPATTIDVLVQTKGLKPPFLIKLDTHGFEVPILNGAQQTLQATNLLIVETYNFELMPGISLRFPQMCAFLEDRGFRTIDLCDPLFRPGDNAFWQMDLFFIPAVRAEFQSNHY